MGQYSSYWLYQRYEQRGSQDPIPVYPNVYSVDADGTMPPVIRKEYDVQCGWHCDTIYRWITLPIEEGYMCDICQYQTRWVNMDVSTDYLCEGFTKYYKQKLQESNDWGQTWEDVTPYQYQKGDVAETFSNDCVGKYESQYLTIVPLEDGDIRIKVQNFPYSNEIYFYSMDSGATWNIGDDDTVIPTTAGNKVMFKANLYYRSDSTDYGVCRFLQTTGKFNVEGNPMSLLNDRDFAEMKSLEGYDWPFFKLFGYNENVVSIENLVLPATTLCRGCYAQMFCDCSSLVGRAPTLPAQERAEDCYAMMFDGCLGLNYIECLLHGEHICLDEWLGDVAREGTFVKAEGAVWCSGPDGIPTTWYVIEDTCHTNPVYKWFNMDPSTDYYCEGTTKYYKQTKRVSYDCAISWQDVSPAEYQKGDVAEEVSLDCASNYKLVAYYSDDDDIIIECNGDTELTPNETKPSGYQATAMTSAVIGNCVEFISDGVFSGCSSLSGIVIPDSVTTIGRFAFQGCDSFASIIVPSGVTSIGAGAFYQCTNLTSVIIEGSGLTSINSDTFRGCSSLTNVVIPDTVTAISGYAFYYCSSLTSIDIPSGVTSISYSAFFNCSRLTNIVIPSGITIINENAFNGCSGLTSVTCLATTPPELGPGVFNRTNNCPIFVPAESVSAYKAATNWRTYASRIQSIQ